MVFAHRPPIVEQLWCPVAHSSISAMDKRTRTRTTITGILESTDLAIAGRLETTPWPVRLTCSAWWTRQAKTPVTGYVDCDAACWLRYRQAAVFRGMEATTVYELACFTITRVAALTGTIEATDRICTNSTVRVTRRVVLLTFVDVCHSHILYCTWLHDNLCK